MASEVRWTDDLGCNTSAGRDGPFQMPAAVGLALVNTDRRMIILHKERRRD